MASPILPYSSGVSPLSANAINSLQNVYSNVIDDPTDLTSLDTRYMLTGSRIEFTGGTPPSDQAWKLYEGTANPATPTDEVNAYNSDPTANARYFKKVGGR